MKKRTMILLMCMLVTLTSVAFGTIAYLTDYAHVRNSFTIGNVEITVHETAVDENGDPKPNPAHDPSDPTSDPFLRTYTANEYPLIPDSVYRKDPTVTITAGSEEAYVRMLVTLNKAAEIDAIFNQLKAHYPEKYPNGFEPGQFVPDYDGEKWIYTGEMQKDAANNTYTLEFRYFEPVKPSETEDLRLTALFEKIRIPGELTNGHLFSLQGFAIEVWGHAIQTTGFNNADDAWNAFGKQMELESSNTQEP